MRSSMSATKVRLVVCLAAITTVATLHRSAAEETRRPPADAMPMSTNVIVKSMSQLLQEGYEISSFSAGLGGYGYLLRHDRSWIMCTVDLYGSVNALKPYSRCEKLSP